ncbi:hypothetical protein J2Y58_002499 [Sphingomonas sp. BE138]|uniref:hypothetical protein n=1 Tax=Sphingomonas sp. BE138 TaxID=2817845 RepID=UPI0028545470|nr:hypothetical protein [Sphingomonas sp. BE138]MDR6789128.1 hypothetical protein [Sphingomonas sp. BE138]
MSPIFQSKPTSEELRRLAHDLLAIRASRFSSGDATLFDDETQNARILSDGALACLQGAAELKKKDDARRSTDRRMIVQLALGLVIFATIVVAAQLIPERPASSEEVQWLSMSENRLSAAESGKTPDSIPLSGVR